MYKNVEARQVPEFNGYDIIAKLSMMYKYTIKYLNLQLSSERDRLLVTNLVRNPRITVEQIFIYEIALNNFTQQTWPDNDLANLRYPVSWR